MLVSAIGAFFLMNGGGRDIPTVKADVVRPIPTAVVQQASGDSIRTFPGKVRASRRVELAFSVPGPLDQLNAEEGGSIRQGEIVARLDQRDYQYALDRAKAESENARREFDRCGELLKQKVATEVEYENAETAHDVALAELHARRKALEDTILRAPFDGLVVKRHVENHEHVQAKQAIISFQDISRIEVVIQVPERLFAHGGADALKALRVRFDADGSRWFDAAVREHSADSDSVTRTYDVVVALAPPSDLNVFPGMTTEVKARIAESPDVSPLTEGATRIPVEALCRGEDGQSWVWVIDPAGGEAVRRAVEAAELCGDSVEIRSGLRSGEQVAIAALHVLREGLLVRPMASGKEGLDG